MSLTESQERAYKLLRSGKNVFLTGGAGVGKSFLLKKFIDEYVGNCLVTAPSGIAAQRIGGVTVHSAFSVKRKILDETDFNEKNYLLTDNQRKKLRNTDKMNVLLTADVLIIDEISMLRSDVFSFVMKIVKTITGGDSKKHIKAHQMQVILCGDFAQLPPVITKKDRSIWNELYEDNPEGWAFKTKEWKEFDFQTALLTEVVRQQDTAFSAALNQIRIGDRRGLEYINQHIAKVVQPGPVLTGTNADAAKENEIRFNEIKSKEKVFDIIYGGEREDAKDLCCDEHLALKVGAKVLFLTNDPEQQYKNGSYGIVKAFSEKDDDETVVVETGGHDVNVKRATWFVERYRVIEKRDEKTNKKIKKVQLRKVGEYSQFPLRLGYALTVHKSQGQDYETLNIRTINSYFRSSFWSPGQLYVALSRVKSVEHLYLSEELTTKMLVTSSDVYEFYDAVEKANMKLLRKESNLKKGWGGKRRGAGRKKLNAEQRRKSRSFAVTDREYEILKRLLNEYRALHKSSGKEDKNLHVYYISE